MSDAVLELSSTNEVSRKAENDLFRQTLLKGVDGIVLCSATQQILFINRSAREMLKVPMKREVIGEQLECLQSKYLTEFLNEAQQKGIYEINKVINLNDDHSELIGVHVELLRNEDNEELGWMITLRDVTLNWQNDQLRSDIAIASHEIRTPLNSMRSALELLLERDFGPLTDEQDHCLSVIQDDISRLYRLLSDILDLTRFDQGAEFVDRRKKVAIGHLAKRVIVSFEEYAHSKNLSLVNQVPKSIPTFKGNRDRIQQVMVNLTENAIKYSYPGGTVEIGAQLQDSFLVVWVRDEGKGNPESEFKSVFQKFKKLDNSIEPGESGYGLGLSIAQDIVEGIGGKIWLESKVGEGTTFFFSVPV